MKQPTKNHNTRATGNHALYLGMIGITMLSSCAKEVNSPVGNIASTEKNVTPLVKQFVEAATDPQRTKSNGILDADSAVWYIEAGLNYSAAQAWRSYTELSVDSLVLTLDLSAGSASESAVFEAYNTLLEQLAQVTTEEQHVSLVDVVEMTTPGTELLVYYQIASGYEKYNNPPNATYPPGYVAWWSTGFTPNCSITVSERANTTIQNRINAANTFAMSPGMYWHSVETWQVGNYDTFLPARYYWWRDSFLASTTPINGGYRETLLFSWKAGATTGGLCLNDTEMGYWTGNATTRGTWRGITKIRTTHCPTKIFSSCILVGGGQIIASEPGTPFYWFHGGQFTFGVLSSGSSS